MSARLAKIEKTKIFQVHWDVGTQVLQSMIEMHFGKAGLVLFIKLSS